MSNSSVLTGELTHTSSVWIWRLTYNSCFLQENWPITAVLTGELTHNSSVLTVELTHNSSVLTVKLTHNSSVQTGGLTHNSSVQIGELTCNSSVQTEEDSPDVGVNVVEVVEPPQVNLLASKCEKHVVPWAGEEALHWLCDRRPGERQKTINKHSQCQRSSISHL